MTEAQRDAVIVLNEPSEPPLRGIPNPPRESMIDGLVCWFDGDVLNVLDNEFITDSLRDDFEIHVEALESEELEQLYLTHIG